MEPRTYLLTGATGFIGHHVLAQMLRLGRRCIAVVRPPLQYNQPKLFRLLRNLGSWSLDSRSLGCDPAQLLSSRQLQIVEAEFPNQVDKLEDVKFEEIIHCAGSVEFIERRDGDPRLSNVEGTKAVCDLATQKGCRSIHLLSTAYVCGKSQFSGEVSLTDNRSNSFNNVYEESKFESERTLLDWTVREGGTATIYRPSVVVGDSLTGQATSFQGFYLMARATELLSRNYEKATWEQRHSIALRLRGQAEWPQNFVPVDYVRSIITAAVVDSRWHGQVYHLTHPHPPSNGQVKKWLEKYFDIGGGCFVLPSTQLDELSDAEALFYSLSAPLTDYFANAPVFRRDHTAALELATGICCPILDDAMVERWLDYAIQNKWGKIGQSQVVNHALCAAYFEKYLPRYVLQSKIVQMTRLTTAVHFSIAGTDSYECTCHFKEGRLTKVVPNQNGCAEYGYRTSFPGFAEAIAGRRKPQDLFFGSEAEIEGNVEQGLKMAMILQEFTKEFPCDLQTLQSLR